MEPNDQLGHLIQELRNELLIKESESQQHELVNHQLQEELASLKKALEQVEERAHHEKLVTEHQLSSNQKYLVKLEEHQAVVGQYEQVKMDLLASELERNELQIKNNDLQEELKTQSKSLTTALPRLNKIQSYIEDLARAVF